MGHISNSSCTANNKVSYTLIAGLTFGADPNKPSAQVERRWPMHNRVYIIVAGWMRTVPAAGGGSIAHKQQSNAKIWNAPIRMVSFAKGRIIS